MSSRLSKGQKKPVGTVSLELKKTDAKHNKFTLDIYADDKVYEKKDRNVNEPLQFYSGKDPALYEIVVNTINSKKPDLGLSFHAEGRADTGAAQRAVTGLLVNHRQLGREHQVGLVPEAERIVQLLARVPLLLRHPESRNKFPSTVCPGSIVVSSGESARPVRHWHVGIGDEDALVVALVGCVA